MTWELISYIGQVTVMLGLAAWMIKGKTHTLINDIALFLSNGNRSAYYEFTVVGFCLQMSAIYVAYTLWHLVALLTLVLFIRGKVLDKRDK